MIRLQGVSKSFGGAAVLQNISLELSAGKTHVLIGPSGCGKSTLLRLIAGLILPNQGVVSLDDRDVGGVSDREKALLYGYMIQDGGLFPHLTNWANIQLAAEVHGRAGPQTDKWAKELGEMVELDPDLLSRLPRQLSGGQRQRVALIRALILNPSLLLLDEPMGALDPLVRSSLQGALRTAFRKLGKTVVLVTHDLTEAAYFADTLTLMKDGVVEQHGSLSEFIQSPRTPFVNEFLTAQRPPPELSQLA